MTVYPAERSSFPEYPSLAFKRDSCYINRALRMTSSMVNTLRIIDSTHGQSVSLKGVCTCLQKEKDLGRDGRGEGV